MSPGTAPATRISEINGDRAEWSIIDSAVFVQAVRRADGTQTVFDPTLPLGEAFSRMPRPLWEEVKFRSDLVRANAAQDVNGVQP
ncbi:hypothetical protein [Nocardia sp. NBC_01388]|uniref:hypothetical protein n=1 Tax=Nocardia sp. NBC_01388 TaxID=2903596 RepID=UPI002F90D674